MADSGHLSQFGDSLIHIYDAPPVVGDEALCGHVKTEEESYRLHRSDNQCEVCNALALAEGRTLVWRPASDPDSGKWYRDQPAKENP